MGRYLLLGNCPALLYLLQPCSRAISAFPTSLWVMERMQNDCLEHTAPNYLDLRPVTKGWTGLST